MDIERVLAGVGIAPWGARSAAHMQYYFGREIERWNAVRGTAILKGFPQYHGHDYGRANRLIIAAAAHGAVDRLSHTLLEAHWRDDADLADEPTLVRLAETAGFDGLALLTAADSSDTRARYEANIEEAIRRSVFGSPTYFIDGDMFYGQDRLEMVERALGQPFAGRWPRAAGQGLGRRD
jgi:2-hydroxychromene-2-carboxylate isomerase